MLSIRLEADDQAPLPPALPGQYLTVKITGAGEPAPLRSYSLSGDSSAGHYRISVKREDHGVVSRWLHAHIKPGSVIEAAAPAAISTSPKTAVRSSCSPPESG